MGTGFPERRERMRRIEIACARVRELLGRARQLEMKGHFGRAAAARERAADEMQNLERPDPTSPRPSTSVRRPV